MTNWIVCPVFVFLFSLSLSCIHTNLSISIQNIWIHCLRMEKTYGLRKMVCFFQYLAERWWKNNCTVHKSQTHESWPKTQQRRTKLSVSFFFRQKSCIVRGSKCYNFDYFSMILTVSMNCDYVSIKESICSNSMAIAVNLQKGCPLIS